MIIDREGNILPAFLLENGAVVRDGEYSICLEYDAAQRAQAAEIAALKKSLADSDYKALKHADGALGEEEYAPIREERQRWRDRINEIEAVFVPPSITREEMDAAEARAAAAIREAMVAGADPKGGGENGV